MNYNEDDNTCLTDACMCANPDGDVNVNATSNVQCSTALQAIDLTRKDQIDGMHEYFFMSVTCPKVLFINIDI